MKDQSETSERRSGVEPDAGGGMSRTYVAVVVGAVLIGAVLRLHALGTPSLWNDEFFTMRDALALGEVGPMKTLSYVPTRVVLELFGFDAEEAVRLGPAGWQAMGIEPFHIRLASCLIGIATVLVLGAAGRGLFSQAVAIGIVGLLAFAPWHVEWSQNARFYVQLFLFYNLAFISYFLGIARQSPVMLVVALASSLCALMSHATAMMIFGVFAIDVLYQSIRERRLPLPPLLLGMLGLTFAVAIGIAAYSYVTRVDAFEATLSRDPTGPLRLGFDLVLKLGAPLVALALAGGWHLWSRDRRLAVYLGAGVVVPIVCFGLLGMQTFVATRYVFVSLYPWLALAAIGGVAIYTLLRERGGHVLALAPIGLVVAEMGLTHSEYFGGGYGYRSRFEHAFAYVKERRSPDDVVFSTNAPGAQYYLEDPDVTGDPLYEGYEGLDALAGPLWFVVQTTAYEQGEGRPHPLDSVANLRAVFPTRVRYPQTTLRVYYRPALEAATPHARASPGAGPPG